MPVPIPEDKEKQGEFVQRCIKFLRKEGTPQKQAVVICMSQWRNSKKKK